MNEHCYLYALTWAGCPPESFGPGVDPRFAVELVRCGPLAALTSRVGLDQFDLAKLQEGTADLPWVSKVALRHNAIIDALASRQPVLPMRLGTLFQSRSSLIAKVARCEADVVQFLRHLEDRQEWAVKIYVDENRAEKAVLSGPAPPGKRAPLANYLPARPRARVDPPHTAADAPPTIKGLIHPNPRTPSRVQAPAEAAGGGGGTQYLAAKGLQAELRRRRAGLLRDLDRLKGTAEIGLRIELPHSPGPPDPSLPGGSRDPDSSPLGYLAARRAQYQWQDGLNRRAQLAAETCIRTVKGLYRSWGRLSPEPPGTVRLAFLVERDLSEAFAERLERLQDPAIGQRRTLLGPWPPYSFV